MKKNPKIIASPLEGKVIPLAEVSDPMFREEMLGKGCAIIPADGKLVSPFDGVIDSVPESRHAIMMTSDDGVELLIHIGIDTVELKGEHFTSLVSAGERVREGDVLIEFDVEAIKSSGYDTSTPIVVTNSEKYSSIKTLQKKVKSGADLIALE